MQVFRPDPAGLEAAAQPCQNINKNVGAIVDVELTSGLHLFLEHFCSIICSKLCLHVLPVEATSFTFICLSIEPVKHGLRLGMFVSITHQERYKAEDGS